jgi:hypothetical protein
LHDEDLAPWRHEVRKLFPIPHQLPVYKDRNVVAHCALLVQHVSAERRVANKCLVQNGTNGVALNVLRRAGVKPLQMWGEYDPGHGGVLSSR